MIRTQTTLMLVSILAMAGFAGAAFVDNFNNGNVYNSDTINGFWNTNGVVAESGSDWKSNYNGSWSHKGSFSVNTSSDFNFWDHAVTAEVRGLNIYGWSNNYAFANCFSVMSTANTMEAGAADAIGVAFWGGYYMTLSYKVNNTSGYSIYHYSGNDEFRNVGTSGKVKAYDLTLDGTSGSVEYTLVAYGDDAGTNVIDTWTGTFGASLSAANWNSGGDSAIGLYSFHQANPGTTYAYNFVDSLTVTPEPTTLGLLGIGGLALLRRRSPKA